MQGDFTTLPFLAAPRPRMTQENTPGTVQGQKLLTTQLGRSDHTWLQVHSEKHCRPRHGTSRLQEAGRPDGLCLLPLVQCQAHSHSAQASGNLLLCLSFWLGKQKDVPRVREGLGTQ